MLIGFTLWPSWTKSRAILLLLLETNAPFWSITLAETVTAITHFPDILVSKAQQNVQNAVTHSNQPEYTFTYLQ